MSEHDLAERLDKILALLHEITTRLEHGPAVSEPLWTTAQVARFLSISPERVRAHAADLGGMRMHDGPRAPLRFDPDRVRAQLDQRRVTGQPVREEREEKATGRRPGRSRGQAWAESVLPLPKRGR